MATAHRVRPSLAATASAACVGLIVCLALRVARFNHITATVRWLAGTTRHHATLDEIMRTLHAVDAAATLIPVRVACLERSLTAVVLLAARRRGVTWQLGVRTPPLATHAWLVDATGKPIDEPLTTAACRPLITVSPRTPANRSMT
jgi:hypothetical protein